jgi:8-oxo-dGTP pyrophosphatase MutT (NUDIX family)
VLLLKRSKRVNHPDTWGLPAGHSENGEKPFQTACRECEEEIGITPYGTKLGKVEENDGKWVTFVYYVDQPFDVHLNNEHSDYKWIKWNNLHDYPLHPFFKRNVDQYKQMLEK